MIKGSVVLIVILSFVFVFLLKRAKNESGILAKMEKYCNIKL